MPRPRLEQTLIFDNRVAIQTDWQGVCANHMLFVAFPEFGLTQEQKEAEWDRALASGVKIIRTFYDVSWAFGETYPTGPANWTSANMLAFYEGVAAMQARGIKVVINTGWSFTGSICQPFEGVASTTMPTPTHEAAWAAWMSETFHQLINVRGYDNVIGGVLFTEPNFGAAAEPIPVGYTGLEYYVHMAEVLEAKIVADDASRTPIRPRIVLVGGQEQSGSDADTWIEYLKANDTVCDVLSSHSYNLSPAFGPLSLSGSNDLSYSALIARFAAWAADASPRPLWVDEGNTVVGGNTDSTGYRATAEAGVKMCTWFAGHMQAGVRATLPWTLQDETHWPAPADSITQQFGVARSLHDTDAVRPAWYAFSLFASLVGGGGVTSVFPSLNGTALLHGTGVHIPQGQRHATHPDGEYTFVAINEAHTPVRTQVRFKEVIGSRTFYRYVYSGERPPDAAANPAYLIPYDQIYTGVQKNLPPNVIPGHSVVFYSTINLQAPTALNLALTAKATTDSTGAGDCTFVNDGNFTNCSSSPGNGWRKADNDSHYVELTWEDDDGDPVQVTIGRLELAFVAGTPGVVWPDYTTSSMGTACAGYTVQYWNGSAFVDFSTPVNVTDNTAPNRTHTFTPVSTTKIRLTVTSAAATGQVNQIGAYAS